MDLIKYLNAVVRHTTEFFDVWIDDLAVFQSKTYSYRIPSNENVLNTNRELSERAFNLAKCARNLTDVFPGSTCSHLTNSFHIHVHKGCPCSFASLNTNN